MSYDLLAAEIAVLNVFQRYNATRRNDRLLLSDLETAWQRENRFEDALYQAIDHLERIQAICTWLVDGDYYCYVGLVGEHCIKLLQTVDAEPASTHWFETLSPTWAGDPAFGGLIS